MNLEFQCAATNAESIGPFHRYPLVVNGWTVPNVQAKLLPGSNGTLVTFTLDNRLAVDVPHEVAGSLAPWIADVVAVSMGYGCHPREGFAPGEPMPESVGRRALPWSHMVGIAEGEIEGLDDPQPWT